MQAVILAAGESSRFWPLNKKHKSLFKIMGRPLIWYTIEALIKTGIKEVIVVQGPKKDIENELKNYKTDSDIKYIVQQNPLGTGDALWQAKEFINGPFATVGGHKIDLADYLPDLLAKFKKNQDKIVFLAGHTDRPWDFGIVEFQGNPEGDASRPYGAGEIARIVENPPPEKAPSAIKTFETYVFPSVFFDYYRKVFQKEDNLIDTMNLLIEKNGAEFILTEKVPISLKYPWDLFSALEYLLKNAKNQVYVGKNCEISQSCYLRGFVSIGDNCRIGNGVEIKNSIIGDNSKIPHLSYVGDSIVGDNCNLGAGTITANLRFDKKTIKTKVKENLLDTAREKFGCVLGNNTQTGINVSLMPGVLIGSDCIVGPGSVVSENLENNCKFYTKFEKIEKSG